MSEWVSDKVTYWAVGWTAKKMMTMLMMKAYNVRRFIQQQMYEVVQKLYIVADHEKDEKKISVMHII